VLRIANLAEYAQQVRQQQEDGGGDGSEFEFMDGFESDIDSPVLGCVLYGEVEAEETSPDWKHQRAAVMEEVEEEDEQDEHSDSDRSGDDDEADDGGAGASGSASSSSSPGAGLGDSSISSCGKRRAVAVLVAIGKRPVAGSSTKATQSRFSIADEAATISLASLGAVSISRALNLRGERARRERAEALTEVVRAVQRVKEAAAQVA
jgi:hypothetical protein